MNRFFILILTLFLWPCVDLCATSASSQPTADWAANVQKISDDLYSGKVNDQFYVCLERVDHKNIDMWEGYAKQQESAGERMNLKYLQTVDGSRRFMSIMKAYKSGNIAHTNELWVAYASNVAIKERAKLNYLNGSSNPNIEMFVSVVTSPDALITSHMGISRTWEAALSLEQKQPTLKKQSDQSMHLHSFAAKVMKMRDPKKVYMLTAPAVAMRNIFIKKMPENSVFVGDSIYEQQIKAAEKDPMTLLSPALDLKEKKGETAQHREERLKKSAEEMVRYINLKEKVSLLKTSPSRIIRVIDGRKQKFTIEKPDEAPLVTFDQSTKTYQWMYTEPYEDRGLFLPYVLVDLEKLAEFGMLVTEDAPRAGK